MAEIVAKFEEPGAEKEEGLTPAEEDQRKARGLEVVDLVAKVSAVRGRADHALQGRLNVRADSVTSSR